MSRDDIAFEKNDNMSCRNSTSDSKAKEGDRIGKASFAEEHTRRCGTDERDTEESGGCGDGKGSWLLDWVARGNAAGVRQRLNEMDRKEYEEIVRWQDPDPYF